MAVYAIPRATLDIDLLIQENTLDIIQVVSPEGLISLKSLRSSGKDLDDITLLKDIIKNEN